MFLVSVCTSVCLTRRGSPCTQTDSPGGSTQHSQCTFRPTCTHTHTTHTHNTQSFYGSLDFVRDNPGEPVPEETFTHSRSSWSSIIPICFLHLVRSMASSLFNPRALQSFSTISRQVFFGLPLGLVPSLGQYTSNLFQTIIVLECELTIWSGSLSYPGTVWWWWLFGCEAISCCIHIGFDGWYLTALLMTVLSICDTSRDPTSHSSWCLIGLQKKNAMNMQQNFPWATNFRQRICHQKTKALSELFIFHCCLQSVCYMLWKYQDEFLNVWTTTESCFAFIGAYY